MLVSQTLSKSDSKVKVGTKFTVTGKNAAAVVGATSSEGILV